MAARAAGFQQRRLEPAAMLVRPFEIEIGARAIAVTRLHHKGVGRSAVEPHVEDVGHHLIIGGVVVWPQQRLMIGLEPGIRAAFAKGRDDPRVDGWLAELFAGPALDVDSDRPAPGALARAHPTGPAFDPGKATRSTLARGR